MGNLGKVKLNAKIGGAPLGLQFSTWYSVNDLPASAVKKYYEKGTEKQPVSIKFIYDPISEGYIVVPAYKYKQVANYMEGVNSSTGLASPRIMWKVLPKKAGGTDAKVVEPVTGVSPFITNLIKNYGQEILAPNAEGGSAKYPSSYTGPRFEAPRVGKSIVTNSDGTIPSSTTPTTATPATPEEFSSASISQEAICDNIWWSIETTSMAAKEAYNKPGTPFWIETTLKSPMVNEQATMLAIRIGQIDAAKEAPTQGVDLLDLVFVDGRSKPILFDWGVVIKGEKINEPARIELELPNLVWGGSNKIGFFPIAGRLCIIVNGQECLYTRIDTSTVDSKGTTATSGNITTIDKGVILFWPNTSAIRLIGTNSQAVINLSAMIFDAKATLHTPMKGGFGVGTKAEGEPLTGSKSGFLIDQSNKVSMVQLPGEMNGTSTQILGAFAKTVKEPSGEYQLNGKGTDLWATTAKDKMYGTITLSLENDTGGGVKDIVNKHYVITLESEESGFGVSDETLNLPILAPAWFRMRGIGQSTIPTRTYSIEENVTDDVMEISESFSSPDRYHCNHSMELTLYNEGGKWDHLLNKSFPVQVGYLWDNESGSPITTDAFVGVILNGAKSLTAGKETITLHCEDYMAILQATLVMNSPYYDGMDAFYVVYDLAARAGVIVVDDSTIDSQGGSPATSRYFVPAGYSFLEPAKWYNPQQNIQECIVDICGLGAKCVYFDGGVLHFRGIQGGVSFTTPWNAIETVADFTSDPDGADDKLLVLDERRTEVKLNSTVNNIFIKSVDRTTRAIIMMNDSADSNEDKLTYRKIMFMQLPALGSFAAVNKFMQDLKKRVYQPITGITIKTANDIYIPPMSFISVDGEKYRVMSLNRTIKIDDNSIVSTITGEWMGAQGG